MSRKIILFVNIRQVIKADNALRANHIQTHIVPVPESISSECGMCIELNADDEIAIKAILEKEQLSFRIESV